MFRHILRRLVLAIPTLFAVVTIIFLVVRVVPGDPARAVLGDYASEETIEAYREQMGLNEPLLIQYKDYMLGLLQGDLGNSLVNRQPAWDQIQSLLPHTLQLTFASIIFALIVGIPTGVISARKQNTTLDYVIRVVSLAGLSVPAFYLGLILMYVFAARLGWFPAVGAGDFSDPVDNLRRLVLPAITLGLVETALVTRMTRSVMLNVLNDDYIRTARAKGLVERRVLLQHAFRAAMVPIVAIVGLFVIGLIGGSVLTEQVFGRPGLGSRLVGATQQFDYNMVQAIMVVYAFIIVIVNIIVDIIYTFVDPRVRHS